MGSVRKQKEPKITHFCLGQREWLSCHYLRCGQKDLKAKINFTRFEFEMSVTHSDELLGRWLNMGATVPLC